MRGAVALAVTAMAALHVLQPGFSPFGQPVSFYVWGRHGWLLPASLGTFGIALLVLVRGRTTEVSAWPRGPVALAGVALLVAAAVPSDRWFPWEHAPSLCGLVHAGAAIIAPLLLLWPMMAWAARRPLGLRSMRSWVAVIYVAALFTSGASLILGVWRDGPPPAIGVFERTIAVAAVAWVWAVTRTTPAARRQTYAISST